LCQKRGFAVEFRIVLPDGTVKYIELTGHPLLSANGEPGSREHCRPSPLTAGSRHWPHGPRPAALAACGSRKSLTPK
jgi:hypothetical protein